MIYHITLMHLISTWIALLILASPWPTMVIRKANVYFHIDLCATWSFIKLYLRSAVFACVKMVYWYDYVHRTTTVFVYGYMMMNNVILITMMIIISLHLVLSTRPKIRTKLIITIAISMIKTTATTFLLITMLTVMIIILVKIKMIKMMGLFQATKKSTSLYDFFLYKKAYVQLHICNLILILNSFKIRSSKVHIAILVAIHYQFAMQIIRINAILISAIKHKYFAERWRETTWLANFVN